MLSEKLVKPRRSDENHRHLAPVGLEGVAPVLVQNHLGDLGREIALDAAHPFQLAHLLLHLLLERLVPLLQVRAGFVELLVRIEELARPLLDLLLEARVRLLKGQTHFVELLGHHLDLIARLELQLVAQIAGADPLGPRRSTSSGRTTRRPIRRLAKTAMPSPARRRAAVLRTEAYRGAKASSAGRSTSTAHSRPRTGA